MPVLYTGGPRELVSGAYGIVGISSIIVNVGKVREMYRTVRELSPQSVIIVGGHVAAIPGLKLILDADHILRGRARALPALTRLPSPRHTRVE